MRQIVSLTIFSILFLAGAIFPNLGLDFKFFAIFYILILLLCTWKLKSFQNIRFLFPSFGIIIIILLFKELSCYERSGYLYITASILIPLLILGILTSDLLNKPLNRLPQYIDKRKRFLIYFFILECSISFLEKITKTYIFSNGVHGVDEGINLGFRSAAFLGHPLQNALSVSIIMSFILASSTKPLFKYSLFFLGWLSLLCFNTRSSILLWIVFISIYLIHDIFKKNTLKSKLTIISLTLIGFVTVAFFIFHFHWGDRLLKGELMDGSAMTRVTVYDIFNYINYKDILWGTSLSVIKQAQIKALCPLIENSFVLFILHFGLIFTIILIISIASIIKRIFKGYPIFSKAFILTTFLLIANANNSLAVSPIPLSVLFICAIFFNPHYNYKK